MDTLKELLPFLVPIVLIQIGLMLVALTDLVRRDRARGPKWAWAAVIVFLNIVGPVIYLVFGREE